MKKFVKTFAVAASMTMALGISSQAAVKSVSVAEPVRSTISKVQLLLTRRYLATTFTEEKGLLTA